MSGRIRHCVECPKCLTRYLIAVSPYGNGSYLIPTVPGWPEEYTLYCSCGRPPVSSRWQCGEMKAYAVSKAAQNRGYGTPEEIVLVDDKARNGRMPGMAREPDPIPIDSPKK